MPGTLVVSGLRLVLTWLGQPASQGRHGTYRDDSAPKCLPPHKPFLQEPYGLYPPAIRVLSPGVGTSRTPAPVSLMHGTMKFSNNVGPWPDVWLHDYGAMLTGPARCAGQALSASSGMRHCEVAPCDPIFRAPGRSPLRAMRCTVWMLTASRSAASRQVRYVIVTPFGSSLWSQHDTTTPYGLLRSTASRNNASYAPPAPPDP